MTFLCEDHIFKIQSGVNDIEHNSVEERIRNDTESVVIHKKTNIIEDELPPAYEEDNAAFNKASTKEIMNESKEVMGDLKEDDHITWSIFQFIKNMIQLPFLMFGD